MKHRDWQHGVWDQSTLHMLRDEHNDLFEAWRKAEARAMETLDENNRLDRELDEARRALESTIRVPFSDSQIEAMAKAAYECYSESWGTTWPDAIRAALAAGGLEPCAVPEYKPEDVALRPERASDEEICAIFTKAHYGMPRDSIVAVSRHDANRFQPVVAAVRARVEAPLLAEIGELTRERDGETLAGEESTEIIGELKRERDALKARVEAPLLAEIAEHRRHVGIVMSRESATRAELKAMKAERDGLQKRNDTQAGQLKHIDGEISPLMSEVSRLKAELEALKAHSESLTNALIEAKRQRDELACKLIAKNPSEPVYGGWHFEDGYKIVPNCELSGNTGELPSEPSRNTGELPALDEIDTLKARVAELEEGLIARTNTRLMDELAALRAELEAVKAERDDKDHKMTAYLLGAHAMHAERDSLKDELAALRQPVDAVRPKHLAEEFCKRFKDGLANCGAFSGMGNWDSVSFKAKQAWIPVMDECLEYFGLKAASYAQAHGCPVSLPKTIEQMHANLTEADHKAFQAEKWVTLPAPETRKAKVRLPDVEDVNGHLIKHNFSTTTHIEMGEALRFAAENASIDVSAGVPSVEDLFETGEQAYRAVSGYKTYEKDGERARITAIRDAVLASLPLPTPHEPTDAQVEALALELRSASLGQQVTTLADFEELYTNQARAAFAHIGAQSRSNAEMQICINRKNKRIDALKACVKKWKAKAATPIASAETLEQLAEIGWVAYQVKFYGPDRGDWSASWQKMDERLKNASMECTAAILRAAKARVDLPSDNIIVYRCGQTQIHGNEIAALNSRIVYGVQLPEPAVTPIHSGPTRAEAEAKIAWLKCNRLIPVAFDELCDWLLPQLPTERAEMPTREATLNHIQMLFETGARGEELVRRIYDYLRPWLRTPTGWELDVTANGLIAEVGYLAGLTHGEAKEVIQYFTERIRPTFECQECAVWKTTYERDKAGWQERAGRARAALEVE